MLKDLNLPGIKGKKVVLTGAYGVFGVWIAEAFRDAGATLCLSGTKMEKLEAMAAKLKAPVDPLLITADLTREDDIVNLANTVAEAWGAPDILVNNAGVYKYDFLLDMPVSFFDSFMQINVRAPFLLSREMARHMIRHKVKGSIVNISSGASRKMRTTTVPYSVSKAALNRLTLGLALELAEYGIRANVVEPGFAAGSENNFISPDHIQSTIDNIPLGRASGPNDAPSAVLYLCSDAAAFITGANIAVDGGNSIGSRAIYIDKKKPTSV